MKQDYAINADYNIGDLTTEHSFLLNGKPIGKYFGDETTIHVDENTNVISAIVDALIPAGTIVSYAGSVAPAGWLICNGQTLENNAANARLWNLLHQNPNFCTGDEVHLPDLRSRFIKGISDDSTEIGATEESGLPNIKGYVSPVVFHFPQYSSGALYQEISYNVAAIDGSATNACSIRIDASRSSSVYKDDVTEVTPPNMWLNYIIKL